MSDGNFNRALLPSTPYASGVKAGKAQERVRVEPAHELQSRADRDAADARRKRGGDENGKGKQLSFHVF